MNRILSFTLMMVLIFSFVGCGEKNVEESNNKPEEEVTEEVIEEYIIPSEGYHVDLRQYIEVKDIFDFVDITVFNNENLRLKKNAITYNEGAQKSNGQQIVFYGSDINVDNGTSIIVQEAKFADTGMNRKVSYYNAHVFNDLATELGSFKEIENIDDYSVLIDDMTREFLGDFLNEEKFLEAFSGTDSVTYEVARDGLTYTVEVDSPFGGKYIRGYSVEIRASIENIEDREAFVQFREDMDNSLYMDGQNIEFGKLKENDIELLGEYKTDQLTYSYQLEFDIDGNVISDYYYSHFIYRSSNGSKEMTGRFRVERELRDSNQLRNSVEFRFHPKGFGSDNAPMIYNVLTDNDTENIFNKGFYVENTTTIY